MIRNPVQKYRAALELMKKQRAERISKIGKIRKQAVPLVQVTEIIEPVDQQSDVVTVVPKTQKAKRTKVISKNFRRSSKTRTLPKVVPARGKRSPSSRLRRPHLKFPTNVPPARPIEMGPMLSFDQYKYAYARPITICHVIDSLGLGGAQTMMCELVAALRKYYGDCCTNLVLGVQQKSRYDVGLYSSYGVEPAVFPHGVLHQFMSESSVDLVIHHRVSVSSAIRNNIPEKTRYMVVNHTVNAMPKVREFVECDMYISVCEYLARKTPWPSHIHSSRKVCVLNGVENDYIDSINSEQLLGDFNIGRCHRLIPSKFCPDSVKWIDKEVNKVIPHTQYHVIGDAFKLQADAQKIESLIYYGKITERARKMAVIKALDMYFYETTKPEGASIAILEGLAAGIPVLCRPLGGCPELIKDGVNGFVVNTREQFLQKMTYFANNRQALADLKRTTVEDFNNRLHIRNTACKYMQLAEAVMKDGDRK